MLSEISRFVSFETVRACVFMPVRDFTGTAFLLVDVVNNVVLFNVAQSNPLDIVDGLGVDMLVFDVFAAGGDTVSPFSIVSVWFVLLSNTVGEIG